ncbi:MAG: PKD domain-containing protein, partial [Bacteroidales bacterium]
MMKRKKIFYYVREESHRTRRPYDSLANVRKKVGLSKDFLRSLLTTMLVGLQLIFSVSKNSYAQCPTHANVDSVHFDNQTGYTTFFLTVDNPADSLYVLYGDGTDTTIAYNEPAVSFEINHTYSLNSHYYGSPYSSYFIFYNRDSLLCYNYWADTYYALYFNNRNCQINAYSISDTLSASFVVYTYNDNESAISVSIKYKGNELASSTIDTYNDYTSPTFTFPKAGLDTLIIISQGDYCASTDTLFFYVYGYPCKQPTLTVTQQDSVTYQFDVSGANNGSIYRWDFYGQSWDSIFESSTSTVTLTLPYNDQINVDVYAFDSINNCYTNWIDTLILTGNQQCYAYFYYWQVDSVNNTYQFYNYSVEGKQYLWDFGDGTTSTLYNPGTHTFSKTDTTYTIRLTVADPETGCVQTYERRITVGNVACLADFDYTVTGQKVTFTDMSNGADEVYWDFGDSFGWSYDYNPTYTYADPGIYVVYL